MLFRSAERYAREKAEHEAKMQAREKKAAAKGKKPRGPGPTPPSAGPRATDQINLTDEESRIMPVAGGGFDQSYNAQAVVDTESMLIVAAQVSQASNDKQQVEPMLEKVRANPEGLNAPEILLADNGYFSQGNVTAIAEAGIEPLIAMKREEHHPGWRERFSEPEQPLESAADEIEVMKHRLRTRDGRAAYALRKQTVEPVFGIIKSVMGFRQFMLRGLTNVRNEWTLVCLAWNLKRMAVLRPQ